VTTKRTTNPFGSPPAAGSSIVAGSPKPATDDKHARGDSSPPEKSRAAEPTPSRDLFGTRKGIAPLPLVTQPMIALDGDDPSQTRVDNPFGVTLRPDALAQTVAQAHPTSTFAKATAAMPPQKTAGPAPEIGLTQHHLPEEGIDPRLTLVLDPDGERAASFRVLRHHLLEVGRAQVVVVSSAHPEEGKTSTAINLALALAECGRAKVLLAETHVRRPQLAEIFHLTPPWCFAEQLAAHRHQPMLPWSLIEIPQLWLHVAAINPRIEKTQLLDGPAFAIASERLRLGGYDHIIVDAPPVLGSADVNLLSDAADCVVMCVRTRKTTARDLRKAIDQIGAGKVAGTVLVEK
jgi:Mrp family chromosome partitioning ATPase